MRALVSRAGPAALAPLTSGAGVFSAGGCAAAPAVLASPLATAVLGGTIGAVHIISGLIFAPLTVFILVRSYRRHRRILGVLLAGGGVFLMLTHYVSHFHRGIHGDEPFMYAGAVLLLVGALFDLWVQRRKAWSLRSVLSSRATAAAILVMLVTGLGLASAQNPSAVAVLRDGKGQILGRYVIQISSTMVRN
ncbi:MAG: MerC family mercury resistance protein [Candidatus Methylomirabilales bacterium]